MESRIKKVDENSIWQEDPLTTYREFLTYANEEVKAGVEYNRSVLSALSVFGKSGGAEVKGAEEAKHDLTVATHDGKSHPLSTVMSGYGLYCSKITLVNFTNTFFIFDFSDKVYAGTVKFFTSDDQLNKAVQIAYRNIVPSEFAQARQLAGPMGYHEYLLDGKNCDAKELKHIRFIISSDLQNTPIKIVIKDSTKIFKQIFGISKEDFAARFEEKDESKVAMGLGKKQ